MDDLPDRPSAVAIGGFNLRRRESVHRCAQGGRSLRDVVDEFRSLAVVRRAREGKFSDRVAWVAHVCVLPYSASTTRTGNPKNSRNAMNNDDGTENLETDAVSTMLWPERESDSAGAEI